MSQDKKPSREYLMAKLREARSEFVSLGWPIAAERLVEAVDAVLAIEGPEDGAGEIERLQAVIERDRTASAKWIAVLRNLVRSSTDSLGCFAYDEIEGVKREWADLMQRLSKIIDDAIPETHALDFTDSPRTQEAVLAARLATRAPSESAVTDE